MDNLNSVQNDSTTVKGFDESIASKLFHGAYSVAADVATGVADEIIHHPLHVLEAAAVGAGIEAAAVGLAPVAAAGAVGFGVGLLAYNVYANADKYLHQVAIVGGFADSNSAEVDKAHEVLQESGRGGVDFLAGGLGTALAAKSIGRFVISKIGSEIGLLAGRQPAPTSGVVDASTGTFGKPISGGSLKSGLESEITAKTVSPKQYRGNADAGSMSYPLRKSTTTSAP